MLEAVIAVLGVLLGVWVLVRDDHRVELLALATRHSAWMAFGSLAALMIAVGGPFVSAAWIARGTWGVDWSVWALPLESLVLVVVVAITLWPLRDSLLPGRVQEWDLELVEAATGRIQELVRQGKASTAAAVVARFAPMADRPKREDSELDEYEEVLDWCLRHEAFVKAMVCEQTMTVANMLKARGWLMREHSYRLLATAFEIEPPILRAEISRSTSSPGGAIGEAIPADCILLKALFDDPAVAESLAAWQPVARSVLAELDRRKNDPSYVDPDLRAFENDADKRMTSPVFSGIHFFRLMVYAAMKNGQTWHMWIHYYTSFSKSICELLRNQNELVERDTTTGYERVLLDMMSTLSDIMTDSANLPNANPNVGTIAGDLLENDSIPKACAIVLGRVAASMCRHDTLPPNLATTALEMLVHHLRYLIQDGLGSHASAVIWSFTESVREADRETVMEEAVAEARNNGMHPGANELLEALRKAWDNEPET